MFNDKLRSVAIIAHVDHGKTTLVDQLFKQCGTFRVGQEVENRVMDSGDLERERGITIAAKNCAVKYGDVKINIIDTPGHADFGGEVERSLSMADGAILLVDASEGPLPQTRFVLEKTLALGLRVIVVINKIDRKDARIEEITNEIYDLFIDLGAGDEQLEFPLLFAIGRDGIAKFKLEDENVDLRPLLDTIVDKVPAPKFKPDEPFQMLVSDLGYSDYLGRLAIGKIHNGRVTAADKLVCINEAGEREPVKVGKLQVYRGLGFEEVAFAEAGEIIVISGIEDVKIGDTITESATGKALKRISIDEPTVAMRFGINSGPLSGKEGKLVQSSKIKERLVKETLRNVALKVEFTDDKDSFMVKGRGEFQMAILIEQMRREGYELNVSRPEVIYKFEDGKKMEPIEHLYVDCEESYVGVVTEKLSIKKGKMINLINHGTGRVRVEFSVPSRSLIGYRDEFLTDTKGTGLMNSYLSGYEEFRGDFPTRHTGSIISDRQGEAVAYALFNLEPRGILFVVPGDPIYEGMIIGENNREQDIVVNACKEKKLTNMRASGHDDAVTLSPIKTMTLEAAINFLRDDELVEATPKSVRLRKAILNTNERNISEKRKK
ncbi:MAG: GTP-binding protein TypA [Candidatus Lambdaproteobacteria bacterium RIFOXYD1_FULL_56_27]|uniref:Large ribosomal subunit assembly factor BipA n=1 Tax=Candidatus Lambdaproteobacteria bacterium RIFOXYD2_FULL_56_26 TaxID=1817773 RepID=A0A1F6H131_9PROT|nr:MAG: GTP-binding protein TypA [Candidatus Lambdaproteobacteria bacterium RIFOXYC1_FULL_56_13]OGH04004.1 MAG: GTP-binding protein TypA [Candidatus Lambdaproteobacteria bacterium RIFOXYD2_FULL_56_26]OGH08395.1 MAG: GTP-binding protein TypA [Candidatus Lambdaproteobacteria bacterium RIFOXYD1_FULL_56_27]